jgi:hypothetical protein
MLIYFARGIQSQGGIKRRNKEDAASFLTRRDGYFRVADIVTIAKNWPTRCAL